MRSLYAAVLMLFFVLGGTGCAGAQESPLVGTKAPDFTLERLSGSPAALSQVIAGKKAIMFFFASWCPHCRSQIKEIAAKQDAISKDGIVLVLVNIGETKEKIAAFLDSYGVSNDAFLDTDSFVAETYGVMGVPTLVFIGSDGKVRHVEYGLPENYPEILK